MQNMPSALDFTGCSSLFKKPLLGVSFRVSYLLHTFAKNLVKLCQTTQQTRPSI